MEASRALIDLSRVQDALTALVEAAERESAAFVGAFDPTNSYAMHALLDAHQSEVEAIQKLVAAMKVFERRLPALQRAVLGREQLVKGPADISG